MQATLIVSADAAPKLNIDIADSLSKAGKLAGPQSLSLQPSQQFSIQFPTDTFASSATADLTYYATLSDRSPLPSWVSFNPGSMVFSGTSSASPQTVDLMLVASDVIGFAGASLIFTLSVSAHQLIFNNVEQTVNVTPGSAVSVTDFRSQLSLDGAALADSDFENATSTLPNWLSFDPKTLDVSGTAPQDVNSTSFTITVRDKFGDVANTTVLLTRASGLLRSAVGNLNAVIGEDAKFDLSNVVAQQPGLQVEVDLGSAAQWLHFNQTSFTISGEIPSSASPETVHGSIKLTTADGSQSDTGSFDIVVKPAAATGSNGTNPRSTSATSNASTTAEASETSSANLSPHREATNNGAVIAVSVVCIVVAIIALVLGFLLYRRSRRPGRPSSPARRKEEISRPTYPDELEWQMGDATFIRDGDVEKGEGTVRRTETLPPQIGVPSPLKKATIDKRRIRHSYRPSQTTSIGEADSQVLHSAIQSGHGRTSFGSPTRRFSSRGAESYSSFSTLSTDMLSNGLLSPTASQFPAPPPSPCTTANRYSNAENRKSVRIVPGSPMADNSTILADTRPLDERRQSYIRNRAVSHSPFFAAHSSSRGSSSQRPSMIGTLADSLGSGDGGEYAAGRTLSPSSYYGPRSTTAGATSEERPQFPGSLRRKRTGTGRTARAYSESSSGGAAAAADTSSRWRSTNNHGATIGPLTGNAPTESPRSSMVLSGLSDSAYTTTEGTGTEERDEYSSGRSPVDHEGDPMDIDDPADLMRPPTSSDGQSGSSGGDATRPPAFMTSPLSPSALRVKKQQPSSPSSPSSPTPAPHHRSDPTSPLSPSSSKENTHHHDLASRRTPPSPSQSFKSNITTSPFHRRNRSASSAASNASSSSPSSPTKKPPASPIPPLPTTPTHYRPTKPSLADLATIISPRHVRRNDNDGGGDDGQQRPGSRPSSTMMIEAGDDLNQAAALLRGSGRASQQRRNSSIFGDGGGGSVAKGGLSAAVRQQLRQRDSIINRGRHQMAVTGTGIGMLGKSASGRFSNRAGSRESGGIGGGGGRREKRDREKERRERRRRSGNGSGAGVGPGAGSRFGFMDRQRREGKEAAAMGGDTGVGAEAPGTMEEQQQQEEEEEEEWMATTAPTSPSHAPVVADSRIPLSTISSVGAKSNFLAPSSSRRQQQQHHHHQPPSVLPPPPPSPSSSSSPSKTKNHHYHHHHHQTHLRPPPATADPTTSNIHGLGSSALGDDDRIFFVPEGKARRPVSVESSPTRFSSMRGQRMMLGGSSENVALSSPPPPPPIPSKSEERGTKTRESSVAGNEAFL
ncbi:polarity establishment/cellular polarization [Diplodia intermedia]|uniref:Polarity establishment/cellular polarization n=1 Tax=Diplodia intermedia TaxID=856260 RepID=A0ABR3TKA3_9PEZI